MNYRLIFCLLLIVAMVGIVNADTLLVYTISQGDGVVGQDCPDYNYCSATKDYPTIRGYGGSGVNWADWTADIYLYQSAAGKFGNLWRGAVSFNTSPIGAGSTITAAKFGLRIGVTKNKAFGDPGIGLTGFTPATNYALVAGDYDSFASTNLATQINISALSTSVYNNWTLNADGLAYISKTSATNLMIRDDFDISGNMWGNTTVGYVGIQPWFSEYASHGPYLEVTYTTGGGGSAPVASFTCTKNFLRIPNSVTCTDSSTNTPTSWSWNMGDGSAAKTTQNVTYPYMKRGIWGITLNATNAQGSNVTAATNVRVVGYENNW
jgi:hypothetical protein